MLRFNKKRFFEINFKIPLMNLNCLNPMIYFHISPNITLKFFHLFPLNNKICQICGLSNIHI